MHRIYLDGNGTTISKKSSVVFHFAKTTAFLSLESPPTTALLKPPPGMLLLYDAAQMFMLLRFDIFFRLILLLFQNPDETCAIDLETTEGTAWDMVVAPSWTTGASSTMNVTDNAEKQVAGSYTCTNLTDVSVRYEVCFHIVLLSYDILGCCWKWRHELIWSRALQLQPIQIQTILGWILLLLPRKLRFLRKHPLWSKAKKSSYLRSTIWIL